MLQTRAHTIRLYVFDLFCFCAHSLAHSRAYIDNSFKVVRVTQHQQRQQRSDSVSGGDNERDDVVVIVLLGALHGVEHDHGTTAAAPCGGNERHDVEQQRGRREQQYAVVGG